MNTEEPLEIYEKVYTGTMNQQNEVLRRFEMNFEKREEYINSIESDQKNEKPDHAISARDPLSSVLLDCTVMDNK